MDSRFKSIQFCGHKGQIKHEKNVQQYYYYYLFLFEMPTSTKIPMLSSPINRDESWDTQDGSRKIAWGA